MRKKGATIDMSQFKHLTQKKENAMIITLKNVRLAFPDLWVAKPFKAGDEPKFGGTFLIPKGSELAKEVEAAILEAANEKWPGKGKTIVEQIRTNPNKFCFQDGDKKSYDGYQGMMSFSAKNKSRPVICDRNKTTLSQADGKPYAGCYVNAGVEIFAYNNSGNGISAGLRWVQFVADGDAFSGAQPASMDEIDDLGDGAGAADMV